MQPGSFWLYRILAFSVILASLPPAVSAVFTYSDAEIVSINKTPEQFIYDPSKIDIVNLSVLVQNNGGLQENLTLNISVHYPFGTTVIWQGCPTANFTLEPYEYKLINCNAYADIRDIGSANIVVTADLAMLTSVDTNWGNNGRIEIITVLAQQEGVTVPEVDLALFSVLLLLSLTLIKKQYEKRPTK